MTNRVTSLSQVTDSSSQELRIAPISQGSNIVHFQPVVAPSVLHLRPLVLRLRAEESLPPSTQQEVNPNPSSVLVLRPRPLEPLLARRLQQPDPLPLSEEMDAPQEVNPNPSQESLPPPPSIQQEENPNPNSPQVLHLRPRDPVFVQRLRSSDRPPPLPSTQQEANPNPSSVLVLRPRPSVLLPPPVALDAERMALLQQQSRIRRMQTMTLALLNRIEQLLPEEDPAREVFTAWRAEFSTNSLQTRNERVQAAFELEWLYQEAIISNPDLIVEIGDDEIRTVLRLFLTERVNPQQFRALAGRLQQFRTHYRRVEIGRLHDDLMRDSFEQFHESIAELIYQAGAEEADRLRADRDQLGTRKAEMDETCKKAVEQILEACLQTAERVEQARQSSAAITARGREISQKHADTCERLKKLIGEKK